MPRMALGRLWRACEIDRQITVTSPAKSFPQQPEVATDFLFPTRPGAVPEPAARRSRIRFALPPMRLLKWRLKVHRNGLCDGAQSHGSTIRPCPRQKRISKPRAPLCGGALRWRRRQWQSCVPITTIAISQPPSSILMAIASGLVRLGQPTCLLPDRALATPP